MDLSPGYIPGAAVSRYPLDHVHFAYAIVVAYAVIEELGLDVQVPKGSYSVKEGVWNPQVRQDLEQRLTSAGVDIHDTVPWLIRSTPTRVERRNSTPVGAKSKWSRGSVRDKNLNLIDAINYSSRLRSRVAAHRFSKPTSSLSQFDVANVQFVARRLLLESMGFWE
jgi:hypothetical protein